MENRTSFYDVDYNEMDRDLSPEQLREWTSIYASYRSRTPLTGIVVGVDTHRLAVRNPETGETETREIQCLVLMDFRVKVIIPQPEIWYQPDAPFPDYVVRRMVGAKIDYVITNVDREGECAIASRRMALGYARNRFFRDRQRNEPGRILQCNVLVVGPKRILVECTGFDISIRNRALSYTAIADLRTQYRPGDELDCIVKGYSARQRELQISVKETESNPLEGAEQRHPVGSRRYAVIAGKYGGGVFCNLPDGTVCMCNYSYQHEDSDFQSGDHVTLVVQRFEREKRQMYGKILSKW